MSSRPANNCRTLSARCADFSFAHGLLGEGARDANAVGMSFANGVMLGDKGNLKLHFDPSYVQMAVDGKL
ncbi:ABC transporter, periplasmic substrate-binding protein [Pseudomonas syringae pv. rhaphiolepidis]|nr:ABC transporter, periplasmic substrate-binding protein [Pseudomonas syringae pv. rhaphiolepidis]